MGKKKIKRRFYIFSFLLLIFLCKGPIYRYLINYTIIDSRKNNFLTNQKLILEIEEFTNNESLDIDEIIRISNSFTAKKLAFTFSKAPKNANKFVDHKKANCIGYAALFNAVGNYLLAKNNLTDSYEFNHLVGQLHLFSINIHLIINHPFFKDHDFNAIKNLKTQEIIYVDPSLYDYLGIKWVSSRQ
ncbi:hypothetical protein [Tenacibaculum agarivorans]|uniref:hypothetical protein n=1 Tax=Tenacibaculum agarivorans TaxID=1908389 RepID=UPI00094B79CC|nr:hypothetical protein [Tenacibaculum agarivorans]